MKVTLLTQYFAPEINAAALRLDAIVKEFDSVEVSVEVITVMPNHPQGRIFEKYRHKIYSEESRDRNTKLRRIWIWAGVGSGIQRIMNYLSGFVGMLFLCFTSKKTDVILVNSPPLFLGILGVFLKFFTGGKCCLYIADLWPDSLVEMVRGYKRWFLPPLFWLEKWVYKNSDVLICVTESVYKTLIETKKIPSEKISYIANGIDVNGYRLLKPRTTLTSADETLLLAYAGNLGFAQGFDSIIESAKNWRGIKLRVAGNGSRRSEFVKMVKDYGLEDRIEFLGELPPEEVVKLYQNSHCALVTIRNSQTIAGTIPVKLLSAMACQVPILFSGLGEGRRLVESMACGLVCNPESPHLLNEAIQAMRNDLLLNEPFEKLQKGLMEARKYVEQTCSWSVVSQKILKAVQSSESKQI